MEDILLWSLVSVFVIVLVKVYLRSLISNRSFLSSFSSLFPFIRTVIMK